MASSLAYISFFRLILHDQGSHVIEDYNQFRKRYKGVELTIVRTKGDATAGDVSGEDEGSLT